MRSTALSTKAIPAGFHQIAVASSAMATKL